MLCWGLNFGEPSYDFHVADVARLRASGDFKPQMDANKRKCKFSFIINVHLRLKTTHARVYLIRSLSTPKRSSKSLTMKSGKCWTTLKSRDDKLACWSISSMRSSNGGESFCKEREWRSASTAAQQEPQMKRFLVQHHRFYCQIRVQSLIAEFSTANGRK